MADSDSIGGVSQKNAKATKTRDFVDDDEEFSLKELLCANKKFYGFLGILFFILRTDIFQNSVLAKIKGATDMQGPTLWGEFITLLVFLFLVILIQVLMKTELI